jgi:hypothetical protein
MKDALPPLVGTGFQVQCPPLIGVLPTVRSPYWVRYRSSHRYLALREGPRRFGPGFTCPTLLGVHPGVRRLLTDGTLTRCGAPFQAASVEMSRSPRNEFHGWPHDPAGCRRRFRLVPVRSPLLRESRLLSVPPGTEMFQFPGSHLGTSGSTGVRPLPRAFRSLPRPACRRRLGIPPVPFGA